MSETKPQRPLPVPTNVSRPFWEAAKQRRLVIQYVETIYSNQRDELVARVVGWCTRHQRRASRDRGKYADVPKRHEYSAEELEAIDQVGIGLPQRLRVQSNRSSLGGAQVVDYTVGHWQQRRQNNPPLGVFQIEGNALFAGIQV